MTNTRFKLIKTEHEKLSADLSAYVDGQLSPKDQARMEAHLGGCEVCRQELRTLRWTRDLLRQAPPMPRPRSFVIREADLAARRAPRPRFLFAARWATAVVSLLFVMVIVGDVLTSGGMGGMGASQAPPAQVMLEVESAPAQIEAVEQAAPDGQRGETRDLGEGAELTPELYAGQAASPAEGTPQADSSTEKREPTEKSAPVPEAAVEAPSTPLERGLAPKATEGGTPPAVQPEGEKTLLGNETASVDGTAGVPEGEQAVLAPAPEESTTPQMMRLPEDEQRLEPTPARRPAVPRGVWRGLQVALGLLLMGLVVTLIVMRRS